MIKVKYVIIGMLLGIIVSTSAWLGMADKSKERYFVSGVVKDISFCIMDHALFSSYKCGVVVQFEDQLLSAKVRDTVTEGQVVYSECIDSDNSNYITCEAIWETSVPGDDDGISVLKTKNMKNYVVE